MAERALSGLAVVEYSAGVAGAMCAKAMADLGADVVKVEPARGDPARLRGPFPGGRHDQDASGQFLYLNANKRGVTIDVDSPEDRARLVRLVQASDLFVTDLSPREAGRLSLDYSDLQDTSPRLIGVYVTPFGHTGPYRDFKGSDLVVWHMGGMGYETPFSGVNDLEREPPLRGGGYQADYLAGWTAATAAMTALEYRETYGVGQMVDVAGVEAVANHIRGNFALYSYDIGRLPENRLKSAFRWIWPCKDGHISLSFSLDHWWEALRGAMGRPKWTDKPEYARLAGRVEHMAEIEDGVCEWLARHTRNELYRLLKAGGVSCFPVLSMAEVLEAPQYAAREFFIEATHPVAGKLKQPGPPARLSQTPWEVYRLAPTLGQHNDEIFLPLGAMPRPELGSHRVSGDGIAGAEVERTDEGNAPLRGVRIIDFGWILSVPQCTAWLGTMGAEVVRVESQARLEPSRDSMRGSADGVPGVNRSSGWNGLNYSKLGVTLNLSRPEAVELVKELVAVSDVVVENFATGVMERLGLGYDSLRRVRPDLIMLSGSTLGVTGPERLATGWGPNAYSYAGLPHITGYRGGPPVNLGGNWPDYLVGTMMAFNILAALRHRRRTGRGQYLEVSMAELVASMIPEAFLEQVMNGRQVERTGNHDAHMSPHNVYPCQGYDQWAAIAVRNDAEWRALCKAAGRREWSSDPRFETLEGRKRNEAELDRLVEEWTRLHGPREVMETLQAAGIAAGPVMSVFDLMEDPHFRERGFAVEMDHPEVGKRTVAGLPARFGVMPRLAYTPAPLLGQHNEFVFGQLLALGGDVLQRHIEDQVVY